MPQRFCLCQGCPACAQPQRKPGAHGAVFNLDATRTLKCPACQQAATARRNARAPRAQRGYGTEHRKVREQLLARFQPGDPCALCGKPMTSSRDLDLAHNEDRSGWKGLSHATCNRATNKGKKR